MLNGFVLGRLPRLLLMASILCMYGTIPVGTARGDGMGLSTVFVSSSELLSYSMQEMSKIDLPPPLEA